MSSPGLLDALFINVGTLSDPHGPLPGDKRAAAPAPASSAATGNVGIASLSGKNINRETLSDRHGPPPGGKRGGKRAAALTAATRVAAFASTAIVGNAVLKNRFEERQDEAREAENSRWHDAHDEKIRTTAIGDGILTSVDEIYGEVTRLGLNSKVYKQSKGMEMVREVYKISSGRSKPFNTELLLRTHRVFFEAVKAVAAGRLTSDVQRRAVSLQTSEYAAISEAQKRTQGLWDLTRAFDSTAKSDYNDLLGRDRQLKGLWNSVGPLDESAQTNIVDLYALEGNELLETAASLGLNEDSVFTKAWSTFSTSVNRFKQLGSINYKEISNSDELGAIQNARALAIKGVVAAFVPLLKTTTALANFQNLTLGQSYGAGLSNGGAYELFGGYQQQIAAGPTPDADSAHRGTSRPPQVGDFKSSGGKVCV